jgi:hypothetical protein
MKWRSGTFSGTTILNEPYIISTTVFSYYPVISVAFPKAYQKMDCCWFLMKILKLCVTVQRS